MSILESNVWIGLSGNNVSHFENLGYDIPRYKPKKGALRVKKGTKILVKIEDLTENSQVKVTKICDCCGFHTSNIQYKNILLRRKLGDGLDRCIKCYNKRGSEIRRTNYVKKNGSIAEKQPDFAKLLWNEEDSYKYTYNSDVRVDFRCPKCNFKIKNKVLSSVYNSGLSCPKCSDGVSYPEKFMASLLNQLRIEFQAHKTFEWSENKEYDFYIYDLNCIIEVHGKQHYTGGFEHYGINGRNAIEEQENDRLKEHRARLNGIENYIIINASNSNMEYIKNSILSSNLINMVDVSNLNWLKCHEYACGTLVKIACDLWNMKYGTTSDIGKIINVSCNTVALYLKQGKEIGWCDYDPLEGKRIANQKARRITKKIVQLTIENKFIQCFESIKEAHEKTSIGRSNISQSCTSKQKTSGGFRWMYKEDYDKYTETKLI